MISKTAMLALVKAFRAGEVDRSLAENLALLAFRDERGRNWLHICCGQVPAKGKEKDSIATAGILLRRGFDINAPAFTEGAWQATPVWYAIARGRNLALAEFLLKRGASPDHSLWAASFNDDRAAIRLLAKHGANLEQLAEDTTPFLGAVKWSKFGPAEELLKLGADPNWRGKDGKTALHYMLKKGSDKAHIAMVVHYGAQGDIADKSGLTAIDALRKKRDPDLRALAEVLEARGGGRGNPKSRKKQG
jgi:ankyrin repeat protein